MMTLDEEARLLLKELLPDASPIAAYAMGMATASAIERGVQPTRRLLEKMRAAPSIDDAERTLRKWTDNLRRPRAARLADKIGAGNADPR